jgi:hypothetical protein
MLTRQKKKAGEGAGVAKRSRTGLAASLLLPSGNGIPALEIAFDADLLPTLATEGPGFLHHRSIAISHDNT